MLVAFKFHFRFDYTQKLIPFSGTINDMVFCFCRICHLSFFHFLKTFIRKNISRRINKKSEIFNALIAIINEFGCFDPYVNPVIYMYCNSIRYDDVIKNRKSFYHIFIWFIIFNNSNYLIEVLNYALIIKNDICFKDVVVKMAGNSTSSYLTIFTFNTPCFISLPCGGKVGKGTTSKCHGTGDYSADQRLIVSDPAPERRKPPIGHVEKPQHQADDGCPENTKKYRRGFHTPNAACGNSFRQAPMVPA